MQTSLQPPADHHLTCGINAMHSENRLGCVETDCHDRLHNLTPPNPAASAGTQIRGTYVLAAFHSITSGLVSRSKTFICLITSPARALALGPVSSAFGIPIHPDHGAP